MFFVNRIVLENHERLVERRIRGSYYIVGDLLAPLICGEITAEDYDWYGTDQGYASYRDDIWPQMEQRHHLRRPEAKPIGIVYDHGSEYPVTRLEGVKHFLCELSPAFGCPPTELSKRQRMQ